MIIWIASYPKSGNTLVRSMLASLLFAQNGKFNANNLQYINNYPESYHFEDLTNNKGPKYSILALGYAGWGPGQLEYEISKNSWMNTPIESSFLFDEKMTTMWNDAYKLIGINPTNLSIFSGNA